MLQVGFSYLSELIANQATSSETKNNGIRWGGPGDGQMPPRNALHTGLVIFGTTGLDLDEQFHFPYFCKAPSSSQAGSWLFFEEEVPPRFTTDSTLDNHRGLRFRDAPQLLARINAS